ncbi:MAG TPA: hypothetical protein VGM23_17625 [Armatimonadota bacterium]
MRYTLFALLAGAMLCLGVSAAAQSKLTVTVWPDKLLYDVGETAKIDVTVTNTGQQPVKGQLTTRVIWEMEDTQTLLQQPVEVQPGEKKVVTATWKTVEVLGCEARADFRIDGQTPVTGSEYFNVCRGKDVQRVGIHVGYDLFTYADKAYLDAIPGKIMERRKNYCNIIEHFAWAPDSYSKLAPDEDFWYSNNGYWESKTAIRKEIEEGHKQGMKMLTYEISFAPAAPSAELMRRHPDWFFYQDNGKPWPGEIDVQGIDNQRKADLRAPYRTGSLWIPPSFALKEPLDYGIQQLIASKKMFGWDGVRFDGHFIMWSDLCKGARDVTGKYIVSGKEAEKITRANTAYTKKEISKIFPDYLFMFNSSVQNPDIAEICSDGGGTANEPIRESYGVNSQWNSWKAFTRYLLDDVDQARVRGGYAYAYMNPPWEVCPNVDRIQYAIMLAAGDHPWFCGPFDTASYKGGTHFPIMRDYFRFATRFSAVLWGHGLQRVTAPETLATVTAPTGTVWWKDFVSQRTLANGRTQLVIHLINEPPSKGIEAETQKLPVPINNITVKFSGKVARAWVASPEPQLQYQQAPIDNGTITVPELRVWTVVIVEMEAK